MLSTANFLNAFAAATYLRIVVERAKKCLDFSATTYLVHLLAVVIFSGFPTHIAW